MRARRALLAAARYVALNPVRAKLVERAQDWPWSSAGAHLAGRDDALVTVRPILERVEQFAELLASEPEPAMLSALRAAEGIGRPLGSDGFVNELEQLLARRLRRQRTGPQPASPGNSGNV